VHDRREAFRSAYSAVKARQCPYLYYQNSQFIVVFMHLEEGQGQGSGLQAILSSSTSALREALEGEDIAFQLLPDPTARFGAGSRSSGADDAAAEATEAPQDGAEAEGVAEEQAEAAAIRAELEEIERSSGRT
jgi:hypothetical protein